MVTSQHRTTFNLDNRRRTFDYLMGFDDLLLLPHRIAYNEHPRSSPRHPFILSPIHTPTHPQITRHVAEIIQRQEFILKLARALMMFGAPTHRLQSQMQSTARVLDIELSCMYLPDIMLISFDDSVTSTSNIKFIRQGSALDLGKLQDAYKLYWKVRLSPAVADLCSCGRGD